ncbi:MAG: bifunctional diaminohydroxyphosphoribosylaminopyrimidine deaminase/5-amino-6-(5-phosphoribosylamino)uracil reductase RibD [Actinomycetia bacterium]|nr:bifunctional diaminohydroxyphosphoribosylaminopyrimidine deaminase/5-amino-6-(5-phosphoribosylamino)uracil reductase RibD [Actinomycetes bacterium]
MERAIARAAHSRLLAPPNPWVGAVLVTSDGTSYEGSTRRPGANHAEVEVLTRAGPRSAGATLYVTLEPCSHQGRTPPCADAIIEAGVARVVIGITDPDPKVAGQGIERLQGAGLEVMVGPRAAEIETQLAPYLTHRRTGRPFVVLKLASTLDGRTAAPDQSSQWITGSEARLDAHRIRAESDAILVGAGTVRADDPRLTVRSITTPDGQPPREPLRVVLGRAEPGAAIHPCLELDGDLGLVLDELGERGVVQLMVEGGPTVAGEFHRSGLVDRYVLYLAPAMMGGDDGVPLLAGSGASTLADLVRLRLDQVVKMGEDLRVDLVATAGTRER